MQNRKQVRATQIYFYFPPKFVGSEYCHWSDVFVPKKYFSVYIV